ELHRPAEPQLDLDLAREPVSELRRPRDRLPHRVDGMADSPLEAERGALLDCLEAAVHALIPPAGRLLSLSGPGAVPAHRAAGPTELGRARATRRAPPAGASGARIRAAGRRPAPGPGRPL